MKKAVLMMLLASLALAACKKEPKTVEFYKTHEAERKELVKEFNNNPGGHQGDPDAINAIKAEMDVNTAKAMKYTPAPVSKEGAGTFNLK